MAKISIKAAALVLGISLAAPAAASGPDHFHRNSSLNSVNQPVVQRTDYVIDLNSAGGGVPDAELYRLAGWFETLNLRYGDRVSVDLGGYGDPRARQDIAGVAAEFGLLLSEGVPVTVGGVEPGVVRVVVSRSEAFVPGCPDWQDAGDVGHRGSTSPNYGCATNTNLARMIANPNDLVLGQSGASGGNADTVSKAIRAYRDAAPTGMDGLKSEVTKGGK